MTPFVEREHRRPLLNQKSEHHEVTLSRVYTFNTLIEPVQPVTRPSRLPRSEGRVLQPRIAGGRYVAQANSAHRGKSTGARGALSRRAWPPRKTHRDARR